MAIIISATDEEHRADTAAREAYWRAIEPGHTDRQLSESLSADVIRKAILDAGIVGLGGATFPAHVKLSTKESDKPELLIINGCECEPYLMCDDALMSHYPARIVEGVELMMKAAGVGRAVIAVEDNKPGAIAALKSHIDPAHDISIQVVKTKYPQGGEKQLVEAITRQIATLGRCHSQQRGDGLCHLAMHCLRPATNRACGHSHRRHPRVRATQLHGRHRHPIVKLAIYAAPKSKHNRRRTYDGTLGDMP